MVDSSATTGFLFFKASCTSGKFVIIQGKFLIQTFCVLHYDITLAIDKSGLLVYSQESALTNIPVRNEQIRQTAFRLPKRSKSRHHGIARSGNINNIGLIGADQPLSPLISL